MDILFKETATLIAMILYDKKSFLDFPRFGIQIPSHSSRKVRTVATLLSHPGLKRRQSEWFIEESGYTLSAQDLCLAHSREYTAGLFDENVDQFLINGYELINRDGSYSRWIPQEARSPLSDMVPMLLRTVSGAYDAGEIALETGFCHFLGGGTHHGHRDFGHGFCPLNDTALAIRKLMEEKRIRRAWVIDVDAHKGDGTAAIFADDERVATLSIHMAKGWPLDGGYPADHPVYTPSSFDIPIESGEEGDYLERLNKALFELKRNYCADFVFVLAGADPWENDALPSASLMKLTLEQLLERDMLVYDFLETAGLPSAWLTAGGYGSEAWRVHSQFLEWALCKRLGIANRLK